MDEFQDNTVASTGFGDHGKPAIDLLDDDDDNREMPPPMDATPLLAFDTEPVTSVVTESHTETELFEILPSSKPHEMEESVKVDTKVTETVTSTTTVVESHEISETIHHVKKEAVEEVEANGEASTEQTSNAIKIKEYKELTSWPVKWMEDHAIDKNVVKLIYWCEIQKSAGVFGGILFLLLSLTCYSLISVVSTFGMSVLAVSFLYRIGMTIVNAVQKTSAEHPLKNLLEEKIELAEDTVREVAEMFRVYTNDKVKQLQAIFLISDILASLKFGVLLWLVSYIGSWFSMLTLSILGVMLVFSLPIAYEVYQKQVDEAVGLATGKICEVWTLVESKLPANLKLSSGKKDQ